MHLKWHICGRTIMLIYILYYSQENIIITMPGILHCHGIILTIESNIVKCYNSRIVSIALENND